MTRQHPIGRFAALICAVAVLGIGPAAEAGTRSAPSDAEIRRIHDDAITIDTHVDIPLDFATETFDPAQTDAPFSKVDLKRMVQGGLDAAFFIVYTGQTKVTPAGYAAAMENAFHKFAAIRRMTDEMYPDRIGLALTAADVRRLHAEGKRIALIGIENGYPIGENVEMLTTFYQLGGRYFSLVHNGHNQLADSAQPQDELGDEPTRYGGLSKLGRKAIRKCNALGIMIDVSHASEQTTLQEIALSKAPVIASHSAIDGVHVHARNLSDRELLALKKNGGVVQVVALDSFLKAPPPEKTAAKDALRKRLGLVGEVDVTTASQDTLREYQHGLDEIEEKWPGADVSDLVDHIDYAVNLIGVDHVGIASDFQGGGGIRGWRDASESMNVTAELLRRGYSEEDIDKIWGGNLLRVMEAVEKTARRMHRRRTKR